MGYGIRPGTRVAALVLTEGARIRRTTTPPPTSFAPFSWWDPGVSDVEALTEFRDSIALTPAHLPTGLCAHPTTNKPGGGRVVGSQPEPRLCATARARSMWADPRRRPSSRTCRWRPWRLT